MSLTPAQILYLHDLALEFGGGAPGVLDVGRVEAAVARAFQTVGGQPAYRTPVAQAAACAHALVRDHPFVDGNKRTAFLALGLWLASEGLVFDPPPAEAVEVMERVAVGHMDERELARWVERWVRRRDSQAKLS
ncbi:type II toxin-antitoxin system death-on-curing family toxin [Thermaerobacter composti]|uniref:Type II toxin-antitoxin system death-on-curing family toxin n=1 Tax=Thermaerobacter composti TaxID=554949 RepID=A0ABZ0QLF0_9FIRM|nr:type II toxin-antitoxin system death-on-curing family toxin [Thermaerobacter composti]WPD18330.1 type II toxin-antitoxin system death-on-curing family toxin [Thermaerobacter composti]